MIGYKLTKQQKELLSRASFAPDQYFNPVPDINDGYFIFEGEVNGCVNNKFMWVKDLPTEEYVPPINNLP